MMTGFVEITVRGFFTSDATGMNAAPSIILLTPSGVNLSGIVQQAAAKFASDEKSAAVVLEALVGKGFSDSVGADDWRFMTKEEVDEYREDED